VKEGRKEGYQRREAGRKDIKEGRMPRKGRKGGRKNGRNEGTEGGEGR
jgi:hypothetical protein